MLSGQTTNLKLGLVFVVFIVIVLADEVSPRTAVVRRRWWRGGFGEEGESEGGRGRALLTGGAAVGAVPGADGLQHAAFSFLQHVLLFKGDTNHRLIHLIN